MELDQLIKKLDDETRSIFENAVGKAVQLNHFEVSDVHFLSVLFDCDLVSFAPFMKRDMSVALQDINKWLENQKNGHEGYPKINQKLVRIIFDAWMLASTEFESIAIKPEYILLAMLENSICKAELAGISSVLADLDAKELKQLIINDDASQNGSKSVSSSALQKFTQNLTEQAKNGKLDGIVGRDQETRQLIDVLSRRRKNNPILVGEAGVGKTAVVEGLAVKIANNEVPTSLQNTALYSLDVGALQAGASVKGEFENRLKAVIKEIQNSPVPAILFIDEAHTLLSSKHAGTQNDAANLLKPALARGELRTIAATTWSEYKQHIESDPALERRFQEVKVNEPEVPEAIAMLSSLVEGLEKHHQVHILQEAIDASVRLSKRFLTGKQLPDKGVSVLDTACARVSLSQQTIPALLETQAASLLDIDKQIKRLTLESSLGFKSEEIDVLEAQKEALQTKHDELETLWVDAKGILDSIIELRSQLESTELKSEERNELCRQLKESRASLHELQVDTHLVYECVDATTIAAVIADWTGIPSKQMQRNDVERVLTLPEKLSQRVIGQEAALKQVTQALQNAHAKLHDPRRPLAVLMLVGPSGVGKTETALALAEQLYGSDQQLTTINMSEFKEPHKVSLLMGAPPGYAGYGKGGLLTEAVRRKPYSVILLDELEKADKAVHEMFYQVFDKGVLRDSEGRDVDFKQTVIIMTSNTASDHIEYLCSKNDVLPEIDHLLDEIQPSLRRDFDPAFLGRVTLVPYFPLSASTLELIVHQQLKNIGQRIEEHYKVSFTYTDAVIDMLVNQCKESDIGARLVAMKINNSLLPELSQALLSALAKDQQLNPVCVDIDDNNQWLLNL
ncbi:MAG: type VI secretion system ATPase TssH [Pseudomonadota bacterium]|nr:type VI secretion system ATPase TssH [Pseudomonadota bacterium]